MSPNPQNKLTNLEEEKIKNQKQKDVGSCQGRDVTGKDDQRDGTREPGLHHGSGFIDLQLFRCRCLALSRAPTTCHAIGRVAHHVRSLGAQGVWAAHGMVQTPPQHLGITKYGPCFDREGDLQPLANCILQIVPSCSWDQPERNLKGLNG
ncbi:hypothetical protein GGS26DRAFT_549007 [Hypomontagnella submonticulosa]|nr:hypothetical protein GGS26DRAFT_549007 [Hypomontagnella submonticulosa]